MTINLYYVMILNFPQWVKRNLSMNYSPFHPEMLRLHNVGAISVQTHIKQMCYPKLLIMNLKYVILHISLVKKPSFYSDMLYRKIVF